MRFSWKITASLAIALLVASGVLYVNTRTGPQQSRSKDVTICQYGDLLIYLPLYIALDQGYFAREGLNVNFINGGGDDKTFAAVSSGSAQFGVSDPTFTAIAREKGRPGLVIGSIVSGAPYYGVTWNEKIPRARSVADLKGLRIATYEAPSTNYALMARSLKELGSPTDTPIVQGAYGTLLAMLKADAADIAMELEPGASIAIRDGATLVFSYPEAYGAFMLTGIYVLEDYKNKNSETVQGVINAIEHAMRLAHAEPERAIEIAQRKFPEIDKDVVRIAVSRMISDESLPAHVSINRTGREKTVKLRLELGDLKNPAVADQTLDDTFAQKAVSLK